MEKLFVGSFIQRQLCIYARTEAHYDYTTRWKAAENSESAPTSKMRTRRTEEKTVRA